MQLRAHSWLGYKTMKFELSTSDGEQARCEHCLDETECDDAYGNYKRGCW